jgi:putative FmdB family regulatory protein
VSRASLLYNAESETLKNMPLYEYECGSCGHRFERIQKFSDPPETTCPKCGGALHKLMGAPAMKFKGSGWYVTDYAGKDKGTKAPKETKDSKDSTEATGKTEGTEKSGAENPKDTSTKEAKSTKDTSSNTPTKS